MRRPFSGSQRLWSGLLAAALLGTAGETAHAQQQRTGGKAAPTQEVSQAVSDQIASLEAEKDARTPAQQKIDSQLLYAAKMSRGQSVTSKVQTLEVDIITDGSGNALVDITADVTPELLQQIAASGGTVQSAFPQLRAIRAALPLDQIEGVAASAAVQNIRPADQYRLVGARHKRFGLAPQSAAPVAPRPMVPLAAPVKRDRRVSRAELARLVAQVRSARAGQAAPPSSPVDALGFPGLTGLRSFSDPSIYSQLLRSVTIAADFTTNAVIAPGAGSVDAEGDTTHRANLARSTFGTTGVGIKIGVLSDSIDNSSGSYAAAVNSGDVSPVTVLSGQAGTGAGEGLAMLEIIHDLAPDAQLYFATANGGQAQFATNIRNLRAAGCDIIIDDVFYYAEAVFQDDSVAQAVNDVTAAGASYFSSAGNQDHLGSEAANASDVWEGNFFDSGVSVSTLQQAAYTKTGTFHNFAGVTGATGIQNPINAFGSAPAYLFWDDPIGASGNDYDLFYTNAGGTAISAAGTNTQNGTGSPYESVTAAATGRRLLIVKTTAAAPRFLHLTLNGNIFYSTTLPFYATTGQTAGHSAAQDAFSVAAAPASTGTGTGAPSGPFPGVFSTTSPPEIFTSDGPRRIFFSPTGTLLTPGNYLATGGVLRAKPDVTAADGVRTTLPAGSGLNPFFGTSAAAPHAGAIAGLLKSYNPALTPSQIRGLLTSTAIDIGAAGYDNVTGSGIVDAFSAISAAPTPALLPIALSADTVSGGVGSVGTLTLRDPAPAGGVTIPLSTVTGPVSVPSSVTVAAGQKTATFPISTAVVPATAIGEIRAAYLTETKSAFLNVVAAYTAAGRVATTTGAGVPGVTVGSLVPGGVIPLPAQTNSTPVAIPDGGNLQGTAPGAAVNSAIAFTNPGTVAAVSVGVNISHTYQTDLALTLIAPDGTSVLLRMQAASPGGTNLVTTFPSPTATAQPLSALFGKPIAGTWKLQVQDYYSGDVGTINSFTLTLGQTGQVPVTTTTDSGGNYAFPNFTFVPGTFTLTPSKAGFNFVSPSRSITVGPNIAGQDFTLSQAGIRTSATVTRGSDYAVVVTLANGGPDAANTLLTKATLGTATPTSPSLPVSLGTLPLGGSTTVTLRFPLTAGASGSTVVLKSSGSYVGGSFSGSLAVKLP